MVALQDSFMASPQKFWYFHHINWQQGPWENLTHWSCWKLQQIYLRIIRTGQEQAGKLSLDMGTTVGLFPALPCDFPFLDLIPSYPEPSTLGIPASAHNCHARGISAAQTLSTLQLQLAPPNPQRLVIFNEIKELMSKCQTPSSKAPWEGFPLFLVHLLLSYNSQTNKLQARQTIKTPLC